LATAIGLLGHMATVWFPALPNGILMALLLGVLVGNLFPLPDGFQPGIGYTGSRLLEFSILFLAFSINYTRIADLGTAAFGVIAVVVLLMVLITYHLAVKVKCPGSTGWLVGFGTAICGSSAIAALAPGVTRNKGDVGIAMAVTNLFGAIGMIALPMVLMELDLSVARMGLLLGGTLHSVGNVVGAGYAIGTDVGEAATTIKLARVALLSPALVLFNYLVNRRQALDWRQHFKLPWYLWGFIGITVLTSVAHFPPAFLAAMATTGTMVLTIAMAAIGLKVGFKDLYRSGRRGMGFGLIIFTVQVLLVCALLVFV